MVIATGQNFPDALASSTLTGANGNAPIILTETATLSTEASAALDGLRTKNVATAIIVGGTEAVSPAVQTAVASKGFTVTRVAGTNRYETAAAIATAADTRQDSGSVGGQKTALIATGTNFPDALAGGPAAHRSDLPLLLVDSTVPAATRTALTSLGITRAVILGGTAAVSEAVATEIGTIVGTAPTRLAGTNRYSTATAIGDYEITTLAFPATAAVLATGLNFPDALAAGPLGGQLGAPIVLTASLPAESQAFLDARSNTIAKLYVAGGTAAIDDATVSAATTAAQTVSNDIAQGTGVTTRPELVSASVSSTNATDGTVVKYCFDEPVGAPVAVGGFNVYNSAGFVATNTQALVDGVDNRCVNARFDATTTLTSTAAAAALTVATSELAAVTDNSNPQQTSPIGDAPLGSGATSAFVAGVTAAPDLVSVSGFTPDAVIPGNTSVTFTFDEVAYDVLIGDGYNLLRQDGTTVVPCSYVSGNGTTAIVVRCANGALAPAANNIARGYVTAGTVTDNADRASANLNPLQAADVLAASNGPDLVSATLDTAAVQGVTPVDRVIYTFDQAVTAAVTTTNFQAYTSSGATVSCGGVACTNAIRNEANQTQVSVDFPDNTLTSAVGASVLASAVTGFGGAGLPNQADEEGVSNSGTATATAGKTNGPDLAAVAVAASKDPFGNVTGATVSFVFDENLALGSTPAPASAFRIYLADGTEFICAGLGAVSNVAPQRQDTVTCGAYTVAPTVTQLSSVVLGTVDAGAVTAADGAPSNPEGASGALKVGF